MFFRNLRRFASVTIGLIAVTVVADAAEKTPGYNQRIPDQVMTPDTVETRLGILKFFDGMPDKTTVEKLYDNLDIMRGVDSFLNGIPATSIEALAAWLYRSWRGCIPSSNYHGQAAGFGAAVPDRQY